MSAERLNLGFVALDDAAPLIVARARGLFADEGLDVSLTREVSWATIRDKVGVGALDGAHMLAPMALKATSDGDLAPLIAPLALSLNGPAVTLSSRLASAVGAGPSADALAGLIARRRAEGASPITLTVVFPHSTHNYMLRDWLAAAGIDPDRDVRLTVAPPARITELLESGIVEGFCAGEPWGMAAVMAGAGVTAVRASQLWPRMPDKVLAVGEAWAERHPERVQRLLRAVLRAAAWADARENRAELAAILAEPSHLGVDAGVIEHSLLDLIFHAEAANAPQPAHAVWLASRMIHWGHLPHDADVEQLARRVYRLDLYEPAASSLGEPPAPLVASFGEG